MKPKSPARKETRKGPAPRPTKTTKRTRIAKAAKTAPVPESPTPPEATPFASAFHYLDAWFALLGPAREEGESVATLDRIPDFDERQGYLEYLLERTGRSLEAGTAMPFEAYVRAHGLDLLDRVILLALLRAAHDPQASGGLRLVRLLRALGANNLGRQWDVLSRVETAGRLRDLCAVHCSPNPDRLERTFRLAPWLVEPLTTGEGDPEGVPVLSPDPVATLDAIRFEATRLMEAVNVDPTQPLLLWQGPAAGPGWDPAVLRRRRFDARLEACRRQEGGALGAEIERLGVEGDERTCWGLLVWDGLQQPVGIPVPRLLRYCGETNDPAATAERLLGPESKLGRADGLRFNRADVPLLRRYVWMSRELHARVVPWTRDDFTVAPGPEGEPAAPRLPFVGFDARGAAQEGRTRPAREEAR